MRLLRLVQELRPGVRGRVREARLDDARAEPLEVGDPRLGEVARLGRAAVADLRRLPQEPDREPVEPRLGHRPVRRAPTRGARRRRPCVAIGPTVSSVGQSGKTPSSRDHAPARLQPDGAARGRGKPDRAAGVRADPEVDEPGGERRGVAGARAAGRLPRLERVVHRPEHLVLAEHAPRELGQVRPCRRRRRRRPRPGRPPSRSARGRGRRRGASRTSSGPRPCRSGP